MGNSNFQLNDTIRLEGVNVTSEKWHGGVLSLYAGHHDVADLKFDQATTSAGQWHYVNQGGTTTIFETPQQTPLQAILHG